jgi:hypothetical protein
MIDSGYGFIAGPWLNAGSGVSCELQLASPDGGAAGWTRFFLYPLTFD